MYSIKNVLTKSPVVVGGAVMALVNLPVLLETWHPTSAAVSGINLAVVGLLGLFWSTTTSNNAVLSDFGDTTQDVAHTAARSAAQLAVAQSQTAPQKPPRRK